jgi:hypothetical protein
MSSDPGQHFVYVYRDRAGNPAYFGQGAHASRPADHVVDRHNRAFGTWLAEQQGQHRVEMIGPLESKEMADAIETALVSACAPSTVLSRTLFNASPGVARFRFRRYGVPQELAERTARALERPDFDDLARRHGPLLFVRIDQVNPDTEDPRGHGLAAAPDDAGIRRRLQGPWQLGKHLKAWAATPARSPVLLVGVSGPPEAQVVIASSFVDRTRWAATVADLRGLLEVPLVDHDIDALQLRGHSIAAEFRLRFERARAGHFRLFDTAGFGHLVRRGGQHAVR